MNTKNIAISKAKEPIRIRFKKLKDGNQSIYFDIYRDGQRSYEFPKLYIVPEKTATDKEQNKAALDTANKIKAKMILEIANNENGFQNNTERQKGNFINYLQSIADKRKSDGATSMYYSFKGLINHLIKYRGRSVTFQQVKKDYCKGFVEYLKTAELSRGSRSSYCRLLTVALNVAIQDDYMISNPMKALPRNDIPRQPESDREYLTIDEVRLLINTPCVKNEIKQAFLFTCLSGLRFSDVQALKWGDIQTDNEGQNVIRFTQKKTQKVENLQVSEDAIKHLPERNGAAEGERIFKLAQNGYTNQILAGWVLAAGLKKRVTFHVARHTNATLLLSLGVPIETVSKLLGHSDIKTTQIYAKVIDQNKRDAVSKLDGLISG